MVRFAVLFSLTFRLGCAVTAADLAKQIHENSLDTSECYRVVDLNFTKEDLKVYLTSGYIIFSKPIMGLRHAAIFVTTAEAGDAEAMLLPPMRSERSSLATFTESPNLDEHFKTAVMIFSDDTAASLLEQIHSNSLSKQSQDMGDAIAGQWDSVVRNLSSSFETRLVHDLFLDKRSSGLFYMAIAGNKLGNFDIIYDPTTPEQIFAGRLVTANNRTYFDTWTTFESHSVRNGAARPGLEFSLENFHIDSTIDPDLKMKSVTRMTLKPNQKLGTALPFTISHNMRVTEAKVDGKIVEVFDRDSLRSNLIVGNDNRQFLLVTPSPLDPAVSHDVEIQHEGEVILNAGGGVYYVASRGTWFPRLGQEFTNYELTFRYPKNLKLVATGTAADDQIDGNQRVVRYTTDMPTRYAGFNLGDYQSISITQGNYKIDVYANRGIEAALRQRPAPPQIVLPPAMPRLGRTSASPVINEAPPPPDPAARLQALAKDVANAVDFMTAQFGPPAFHNLAISPIPGTFGQGFPGLVYLSTMAYLSPEQRPAAVHERSQQTFFSEILETHEVAHQWWGNLVIPASYQDEWLMEALANYSALLLLEKKKGTKAVDAVLEDYRNSLLKKSENGHTVESSGPITWGLRLQSSLAPGAWRAVTYEKGTWIIHMLRRRLGDDKFFEFLHEVCARYRFKPISTAQFRELAEKYMPPKSPDASLKSFFENWIYGTGIPAVKMTYAWKGTRLTGTLAQKDVEDDFAAFVPVEVQVARKRTVYWLTTGSDPVPFSIPMKLPPTKVSLLMNDCLMTPGK